eukprot:3083083-Pleurochrysis_carterae.AAC.1
MPTLQRLRRWHQRQQRYEDSSAGSAVKPATAAPCKTATLAALCRQTAAALCRQWRWQRRAGSDAGAAGTATLTALCS